MSIGYYKKWALRLCKDSIIFHIELISNQIVCSITFEYFKSKGLFFSMNSWEKQPRLYVLSTTHASLSTFMHKVFFRIYVLSLWYSTSIIEEIISRKKSKEHNSKSQKVRFFLTSISINWLPRPKTLFLERYYFHRRVSVCLCVCVILD